jgi:hypothetical protein
LLKKTQKQLILIFPYFFFRSVFFFLVCSSFLSQVADLGGEAVAGWPVTWRVGSWFRRKELRSERGGEMEDLAGK